MAGGWPAPRLVEVELEALPRGPGSIRVLGVREGEDSGVGWWYFVCCAFGRQGQRAWDVGCPVKLLTNGWAE